MAKFAPFREPTETFGRTSFGPLLQQPASSTRWADLPIAMSVNRKKFSISPVKNRTISPGASKPLTDLRPEVLHVFVLHAISFARRPKVHRKLDLVAQVLNWVLSLLILRVSGLSWVPGRHSALRNQRFGRRSC